MLDDVTGPPDVTVVMPTYQRWQRLGRTLQCALDQVGVDLEVLIVSDGEQKMPPDFLPPDEDRVRVIYPPVAKGVAHARNLEGITVPANMTVLRGLPFTELREEYARAGLRRDV